DVAELPATVAERARLQRTSIVAAAAAGADAAREFRAVAPEGPLGEVFAGAAASIAHDWDDYLSMGHAGHSAVPVASAFAPAAEPAVQGARAAQLSAEGLDGPLGVVEDRRGLLRHLAFAGRPAMLGELGRVWLTDTLAFKPHPGCAYLQPAVDAILGAGVTAD